MAHYECKITARRNNVEVKISSNELLPGDIMVVPNNCLMPCDAVLMTGSAIVNESMLTGESVPVIKNSLSPFGKELYDPNNFDKAKKFTLYSGTKII